MKNRVILMGKNIPSPNIELDTNQNDVFVNIPMPNVDSKGNFDLQTELENKKAVSSTLEELLLGGSTDVEPFDKNHFNVNSEADNSNHLGGHVLLNQVGSRIIYNNNLNIPLTLEN